MKKLYLIVILALNAFAINAQAAAQVGLPAPEFKIRDAYEKVQSINDYKGKVVVLEWFNPECPYVQKFYNSGRMQEWQAAAKAEGIIWITVNSAAEGKQGYMSVVDTQRKMDEFKIASASFIPDPAGEIGRMYGATATPHIFVIDKEGKLVYKGAIDNKPSAKPEDIDSATNYLLATLAHLREGSLVQVTTTEAYGCGVKY